MPVEPAPDYVKNMINGAASWTGIHGDRSDGRACKTARATIPGGAVVMPTWSVLQNKVDQVDDGGSGD